MHPYRVGRRAPLAGLTALALATSMNMVAGSAAQSVALVEPPCAGDWCPLATFDDYANGSLRTQGTWHVNLPGATDGARASDEVPAAFSGKAMINELDTGTPTQFRGNAYAELGELSIADDAVGTLFFEFLTDDVAATDVNLGLSPTAAPGLGWDDTGNPLSFGDYAVQVNIDERGLVVRDGGNDLVIDNVAVESDQLYAFWLVADNATDSYQVHVATGDGAPVRAASGDVGTFAFRQPTTAPLVTFLHLNDPDEPPTANSYLDTLYVNPAGSALDNPGPVFDEIITFEGYATGSLTGQDGWVASSAAVGVTADPAAADNQVVAITGSDLAAHRAIPAIAEGGTGTIFFRLYRGGSVDTSAGLSDVDAPSTFSHFQVQANNQNSITLNARDGGRFSSAGAWTPGGWQCIWMVADNATDSFRMYSRGGPYPVTTRLPVDEEALFAFRNGSAEALDRFFMINGGNSEGDLYIDDIAVDADARNLRVPGGDAASCPVGDDAELPVIDPIPEEPIDSGLGLTLEEYTTIPPSSAGRPLARINYLGELPDGSGRTYVPDLNGSLHLVEDGEPIEYLDVAAEFPDFVQAPGLGTGFEFVTFHPEFATNGRFYTAHTEAGDALTTKTPDLPHPDGTSIHGVVTEWTADEPAANTFSGTRREVLRLGYDTTLHGMQQLDFNPTAEPGAHDYGLLYLSSGDGEQVPNWTDGPQNLGRPQGKILRVDPQGTNGANGQYGIPPSNPFVGDPGALGEIYALGMRNPHRFSWDPADGRMFLGHIGEQNMESVYEVRAGDNFGWNVREGAFLFKKSDPGNLYPLPEDDEQYGFTYPVAAYDHDTGNAIVGGFVYRGDSLPQLRGKYVFTDVVRGRIFYTEVEDMQRGGERAPIYEFDLYDAAGNPVTMRELSGGGSRVDTRLGIDADGELYVLSKQSATIWKITDAREFASCAVGETVIGDVMGEDQWAPVTPEKWQFPGGEVVLAEPGEQRPGPRRPFEYAVLTAGPEWGSVQIDAEVAIDVPTPVGRDVVLVFGYQSDTEFYYVHLSEDDSNYAHNGIFVVDDADRERIDHQWNGSTGAAPAITDEDYHQVRVRHCAESGEIAVYVDGSDRPLMTATDTTFAGGRVGFGSFDDVGRIRNLAITGTDPVHRHLEAAHADVVEFERLVSAMEADGRLAPPHADHLVNQVDALESDTQAALDARDEWDEPGTIDGTHHALAVASETAEWIDARVDDGSVDDEVADELRAGVDPINRSLSQASAALLSVEATLGVDTGEVRPGDSFVADATIANEGQLPVDDGALAVRPPEGWTARPLGPATVDILAPGEEFTASFELTVPATQDVADGVSVEGVASYTQLGGTATVPVSTSVDVAPPVEIAATEAEPRILDQPGDSTTLRVTVDNHSQAPTAGVVAVSGPAGWTVEPAERTYELGAGEEAEMTFDITSPPDADRGAEFDVRATYEGDRPADDTQVGVFFEALSWEFDEDGDTQGWQANTQLTPPVVAAGALSTTSTGGDPFLVQQETLSADAAAGLTVEVVMHSSVSSAADVYWGTANNPTFSEQRRVGFEGGIDAGATGTYWAEIPSQDSTLTLLRIDPLHSAGDIRIDAIRVLK